MRWVLVVYIHMYMYIHMCMICMYVRTPKLVSMCMYVCTYIKVPACDANRNEPLQGSHHLFVLPYHNLHESFVLYISYMKFVKSINNK